MSNRGVRRRLKKLDIGIGVVNEVRVRALRDAAFEALAAGKFYSATGWTPSADDAACVRRELERHQGRFAMRPGRWNISRTENEFGRWRTGTGAATMTGASAEAAFTHASAQGEVAAQASYACM